MPGPLTKRQTAILDFIRTAIADKGYPPSLREVGDAVGLTTGSVHSQLVTLQTKGYIVRDPGRPRALTLVDHTPPPSTPACSCDLAEKILDLHKPWYQINGVRHNQYVVSVGLAREGHVCFIDGVDRCQIEPDAPEDSEHVYLACTECRPLTEDAEPGYLYWPCPTAQLAGAVD